jgi:hypothetical protein
MVIQRGVNDMSMIAVVARNNLGEPWGVVTSYNAFFLGEEAALSAARKAAASWSANMVGHDVRLARIVPKVAEGTGSHLGAYCDSAINSGEMVLI